MKVSGISCGISVIKFENPLHFSWLSPLLLQDYRSDDICYKTATNLDAAARYLCSVLGNLLHCMSDPIVSTMPETNTLRLSELSAQVEKVIQNTFESLRFWVIADVTNHSYKASGNYHYFELVEKVPGTDKLIAKFSSKAWGVGSQNINLFESRTGQKFKSDIQVLVCVKVTFHATFGLQLEVTDIDHNFTIGVLEQQRQQTLEKLLREYPQYIKRQGEEYWTKNKSLPLPLVIQKIAVITGKTSAGWQDFLHTIENNPYDFKFSIVPYYTEIQGEDKAQGIQNALVNIYQSPNTFDIVVIIRGGGAQTDFLLFDHYLVARAIARFPVPVFTGIGHQKNTTIADMMAHTSVKTPTKVAEFILNHNRDFQDRLTTIQKNILIKVQQGLSEKSRFLDTTRAVIINTTYRLLTDYKEDLAELRQAVIDTGREIPYRKRTQLSLVTSTMFSQPKIIVGLKFGDLYNTVTNLKIYQARFVQNSRSYLGHYITYFAAVSPENTVKRGFAIVKHQGRIIGDPGLLKKGDNFTVILQQTELISELKDKKPSNGI